jgi:hypothetical protein
VDRELDVAAGRRRSFRDQLRLDSPRLCERRNKQQGNYEDEPPQHPMASTVMLNQFQHPLLTRSEPLVE